MKTSIALALTGILFAAAAHSANRGHIYAMYPQTASAITLQRARNDFAQGRDLVFAVDGTPRNYVDALIYLRHAASMHYAPAQALIGLMYDKGDGVPQDYAEAVQWYRLAANQAYARAQINLGDLYVAGHGVPRDPAHAYASYAEAKASSTLGSLPWKDASGRIANLGPRMTSSQIAAAQHLMSDHKTEKYRSDE